MTGENVEHFFLPQPSVRFTDVAYAVTNNVAQQLVILSEDTTISLSVSGIHVQPAAGELSLKQLLSNSLVNSAYFIFL